jgi:hypothetical protein
VSFSPAVAISANQTYVASYHTSTGHYSIERPVDGYFVAANALAFTRPPLRALVDGTDGRNGGYTYGSHAFPLNSYAATNYWVDVVFTPSAPGADAVPPVVSLKTPSPGATDLASSSNVTALFNEAIDPASLTSATFELRSAAAGLLVPAAVSYDAASRTATLDPSVTLAASTVFTATLHGGPSGVRDLAGNGLSSDVIWSFTTSAPVSCDRCTIWSAATTPSVVDQLDSDAVARGIELGVRFRADVDGLITGIRFFKSAGNVGVHTGTLWDGAGNELATATFTAESASGWQEMSFSPAVAIAANQTYVASYHTSTGHYSIERPVNGYFVAANAAAFTQPPLRALVDGADGRNGGYTYGSHAFPTNSYAATNYWVDVVFKSLAPINHSPVAVNDSFTIIQDQTLNVGVPGVLGNDADADADALGAILVTPPAHGALTLFANGALSYTPSPGFNGVDTLTYKVNDGLSDSATAATVTITVLPVN